MRFEIGIWMMGCAIIFLSFAFQSEPIMQLGVVFGGVVVAVLGSVGMSISKNSDP